MIILLSNGQQGDIMEKLTWRDMADEKRPSDVFRQRLRETRKAHGLTQGDVGARMREAGFPMDKAAVQRVEKGERGISLDEALAFASVLSAVPAQLLTPPGDEDVYLTKNVGVNGAGMRAWLRYGDAFIADGGDLPDELFRDRVMQAMAVYAQALVDAKRNDDKAGIQDAYRAIETVLDRERERQDEATRQKADTDG
jgi:transcriptional regulator with XRE-family HTH domain